MRLPRYPSYKDSGVPWLGEVPQHWDVTRFKNALTAKQETVGVRADDFLLLSLTLQGVIPRDLDNPQGKFPASFETYQSVAKGDLVFCLFDVEETPRTVGISRYEGMVTGAYTVARAKCDFVGEFLFYYYYARDQYKAWRMFYTGLRNVIRWDNFGDIPCLLPSKEEQLAIATFLDRETAKIDALIAEQEKLMALLAEKRQATISHAVTRGLNPDAPMKDSGVAWLGEVPAHWRTCSLKMMARIGNGSTPNRDNPGYWADEGFPWLNSSVVNQDEVSEAERFVTALALKECHLPIVEPPAVLVGITGQGKTRGMATRLVFTATVNQHLAYIKPVESSLTEPYLLWALVLRHRNNET